MGWPRLRNQLIAPHVELLQYCMVAAENLEDPHDETTMTGRDISDIRFPANIYSTLRLMREALAAARAFGTPDNWTFSNQSA